MSPFVTHKRHSRGEAMNTPGRCYSIPGTSYVQMMVALGALSFPITAWGQTQVGCGTNAFQDWYIADASRWFAKMQGTITDTPVRNSGGVFDDGDWNIWLLPSGENRLELEVNASGPNLTTEFPRGTRVEAYGLYVKDGGHGNKLELHPLMYLRTLDQNPVRIFVAQDQTGRFAQTELVNWQPFDLPINVVPAVVTPAVTPPSNSVILRESAQISRGFTRLGITSDLSAGLFVGLDGWAFHDCENVQVVSYGDGPFYFGTITETRAPLLTEAVRYSVGREVGTNQKIANLSVDITLSDPPGAQLTHSVWEYESSAGTVIGVARETKTTRPHRFTFSMPYSPALGYNQHSWMLTVVGSTRPPYDEERNTGDFAHSYDRTFVVDRRTYALEPSRIDLSVTGKGAPCPDAVYLHVDTTRLLPQIGLRSARWKVQVLRDATGFPGTGAAVVVSAGTPLDHPGFRAEVYVPSTAEPRHRLDITWKQLASGQPNAVEVAVVAEGVTELVEQVSASRRLSPLCGVGSYSATQVHDFMKRYWHRRGFRGEAYKMFDRARGADRRWLSAYWRWQQGQRLDSTETRILLERVVEGSRLPALPRRTVRVQSRRR